MQCQGCSARDAVQGMPGEHGLLHSPLPPSPTLSGEKSPSGHPAPGAGIEPVSLAASAPRERRNGAGTEAPGVPCRLRPRDSGSSSAPPHPAGNDPGAGPRWKAKRQSREEHSRAVQRGQEEEGLVLFAVASFVPRFSALAALHPAALRRGSGASPPPGLAGIQPAVMQQRSLESRSSFQSSSFRKLAAGKGLGGSCAALSSVS